MQKFIVQMKGGKEVTINVKKGDYYKLYSIFSNSSVVNRIDSQVDNFTPKTVFPYQGS